MLRKTPIVGCPIRLREIFSLSLSSPRSALRDAFSIISNTDYTYFTNSATSSFYIILEALKKVREKNEVIIPAYTASALIFAAKKSGLKPVLCDISLDDFTLDSALLPETVTSQTLCIVGVHMFGIVEAGLPGVRDKYPGVFTVEDCAQALGSQIDGIGVGNLGDISFFSFNRGKNIPTSGGGCITTKNNEIAEEIKVRLKELKITGKGLPHNLQIAVKMSALSLATNPWIYGMLYPFISCFKDLGPSEDFEIADYSDLQARIALSLMRKLEAFSNKRFENGMKLIAGLKNSDGIILPKVQKNSRPAFNRLPILFKDLNKRKEAARQLWQAGVETSLMYCKPLHHMFDLGYHKGDFPNAVYLSEHLLTLPVHPSVEEKDLFTMIDIIRT